MSLKTDCTKRFNAMKSEFTGGWQASCQDLSTYINQKHGYFGGSPNRGTMINHQLLLDEYATHANKILASGLLSGMTSPSRQWFRLTLDDVTLDNDPGIRPWLDDVQKRMVEVLNKSNIYSTFYSTYEELGQFGTGCYLILDDFDTVIRCRNYSAGEYWVSTDGRGRVNSFAREFWMTVGQLVNEFGLESCSGQVQASWRNKTPDQWVKVQHLIEPNNGRVDGLSDNKNMAFRSAYWEAGEGTDQFLALRGYNRFPVIAPRWEVATTDQIYGFGPGWYALGNIKQLQKVTLDGLLMEEKLHKPPMQQDASVEGSVNLVPGGVTKISGNVPNSGVRPAFQIPDALASIEQRIMRLYERIDRAFYVNLFMMLMNMQDKQMTATEVAERQQEKIMMMGPVLYRIQEEMLDPTMELVFEIMNDSGLIPPPPEKIAGMNLKVKYVSILAQAQQELGVQQINRVIGFVAANAPVFPDMIDVINQDEAVREVNAMEGAPSKLLNDAATVQAIREQKQKMMQAQQAMAMAESASKSIKNAGTTPTGQGSMLDAVGAAMQGNK